MQYLISSLSLQTTGLQLGPIPTPHNHPPLWTSQASGDSPSAEWQTCCWGCAGAQLHASLIPGGRSSASSRSNSAQLGAVRGLRGMTPQIPAEPVGSVGPNRPSRVHPERVAPLAPGFLRWT